MQIVDQMLFGAIGGLVRGIFGIIKHFSTVKNPEFHPRHLVLTVIGAAFIGAFVGVIAPGDYRIALAGGYLGTDVIEGIFKSYMRKR